MFEFYLILKNKANYDIGYIDKLVQIIDFDIFQNFHL